MATDGLFNTTISLLGRSLDLRAENHNRISANIANSETPGYVPTGLSFDKELQEAVRSRKQGQDATQVAAHPRHIPLKGSLMTLEQVTGTILEDKSTINSLDKNGVELENEMGKMVSNQIMFSTSIQLLNKKFDGLKTAIKGGV